MGSTNILVWNPSAANQESDATYTTDSLRTGGAQSGAILPSPTDNKFRFQTSSVASALGQALANKGFIVADSPYSALVTVMEGIQTTADLLASMVTIAYATSMTFNMLTARGFETTLTGNVSAASLTNTSIGTLAFVIHQDATGGRTFTWPSQLTPTGQICSMANSTSVQFFQVCPSGAIVPTASMLWITSSGVVLKPTGAVVGITTSGTVASSYATIVEEVNCAGGAITRSLYSAVGTQGFQANIKKVDTSTNSILVQPLIPGQTIDGFPNYTISNPFTSICFFSDGANFVII